tara:strand:+ start:89 stop:427 length:339 start_codon:yes stop_codon:yes gene_type:complete
MDFKLIWACISSCKIFYISKYSFQNWLIFPTNFLEINKRLSKQMKIAFIIILIIGFLFGASRMFEKGDVVLKVGDVAPDFTLLSQNKKKVTLKDYRGKRVVVYFFPKADTPG